MYISIYIYIYIYTYTHDLRRPPTNSTCVRALDRKISGTSSRKAAATMQWVWPTIIIVYHWGGYYTG